MGFKQLGGVARDIEINAKAEEVDHDLLSEKVKFLVDTLLVVLKKRRENRS